MNSMFTNAADIAGNYISAFGGKAAQKGYDAMGPAYTAARGSNSGPMGPQQMNGKFTSAINALNTGRKAAGVSAVMGGSMAGAGYGAMSDDTSMIGGAFMGAGMGYGAKKFKTSMFS